MEKKIQMPIFAFILFLSLVSGNKVAPPEKLDVNIWDGEVTVTWEDPVNLPSYYWYNVEMGRYGGEWKNVSDCMKITKPFCDITKLIENYDGAYKVRVRLVTPHHQSGEENTQILPKQKSIAASLFYIVGYFQHHQRLYS
ncbi:hypothetical protein FQA47_014044 [Oryzias melastigma]|uniref:Fibronectin type-III domain-containing protein n=1 Tax=Oryzias melastigma TaxID=30732 RepID=A0A834FM53_ORYME|nr:hypothetical protein FQA47_014044 [Oryzias melastigma]